MWYLRYASRPTNRQADHNTLHPCWGRSKNLLGLVVGTTLSEYLSSFVMSVCVLVSGVFIGLGLSGVIPAMHYVITNGFYDAIYEAALGWLSLMAILYIVGAVIYAARIPERIWPGRFDIWVHLLPYCS